MEKLKFETLSKQEMASLKGGGWVYDPMTGTWIWIEIKVTDPNHPKK